MGNRTDQVARLEIAVILVGGFPLERPRRREIAHSMLLKRTPWELHDEASRACSAGMERTPAHRRAACIFPWGGSDQCF